MGKNKGQRYEPPMSAFTRMNYLYQASQLMSKISPNSQLSSYYGRLMKDVSKKVVEKVHPDVKRTLCLACNHPFLARSENMTSKLQTYTKRKKHKKLNENLVKGCPHKNTCHRKSDSVNKKKYSKSRTAARCKHPNKMWWSCTRCGFARCFIQRPNFELWINKEEAIVN